MRGRDDRGPFAGVTLLSTSHPLRRTPMRLLALVLALLAGLLVPTAAHAAEGSPTSPLLPPEVARNLHPHSAPESTIYTAVTDYPAELRALTHVLDNYTEADDATVHAGMIMLYYGHASPD